MADNFVTNSASGGVTFASDEDGSTIHWPYVKLVYGPADTQTIVTTSAPLPVDLRTDNLSGNLDVNLAASGITLNVSSSVTAVVPGTGATQLGKAEDAAHSTGDVGVMALAVRADSDGTLVGTSGDYAPLQVDANGYLKVEIFDGGGSHTVDGTVTANAGTGTFTVTDDGSFTLAANSGVDIGDVTINNASGASAVNIQDGGNSITIDGTVTAVGDVAHDGADSGNPVKIGAVARTAHPTAVADGDRVNAYADDLGRLVNQPFVPRDLIVHNQITLSNTTETTLIAAGGAGVFQDLVYIALTNTSATQVRVDIRDDTAGTVRFSMTLAANGGGASVALPVQLTASADNDNWTAQLSGSVSSVYITAIAIKQN